MSGQASHHPSGQQREAEGITGKENSLLLLQTKPDSFVHNSEQVQR